ncbi:hypothetical protein SCE1572_48325 [Sorangium cellulosum So0157-2]|uniref:Uncharacterized protein n=1 Tax=Sorangium cellulosum So0157-2 TaxID=1254432 RepID=S4Y9N6_SORCE|nr:hypothetical protein SCE1572_48325 [Sorangium cellulosum So0157-2]
MKAIWAARALLGSSLLGRRPSSAPPRARDRAAPPRSIQRCARATRLAVARRAAGERRGSRAQQRRIAASRRRIAASRRRVGASPSGPFGGSSRA